MLEDEKKNSESSNDAKPYDYHDLSVDAPLNMDVKENDYTPEAPVVYDFKLAADEVVAVGNALSGAIAMSWVFDPKDTIDDDVRAAYQTLQLLKRFNAALPETQRMGCICESLLPFQGGDVYMDVAYRVNTKEMGEVVTVAGFNFDTHTVAFRLFDPVKYPNARSLHECLGDEVPLADVLSIEEISALNDHEKEIFSKAIREAWVSYY